MVRSHEQSVREQPQWNPLPIYSPTVYSWVMVNPPSLDRYDFAVFGASALILVVAYSPPVTSHLLRVTAWLTVFTLYVGWLAFFGWKWMYDAEL